jgi:UDP-N-acetylglucosamine acyltransferase
MSYAGINSVGLRRRGMSNDKIFELQKIYKYLFQSKMNISQASKFIEKEMLPTAERDEILEFIKNSPRGILKGYGTGKD